MNRPDFEKLYKLCYRRYHDLLNGLEDRLKSYQNGDGITPADLAQSLASLHNEHTTQDWEN